MVSIGKCMSEFERICELQRAAMECYRAAIRSAAQYAVEFDDGIAASHRQSLAALASGLRGEVEAPELLATRAALGTELCDYHDKASAFLTGLREDLSRKARALDLVADAMAAADGDQEERLQQSLKKLHELSETPEASPLRKVLLAISDQLAEDIERMKQQNSLTFGQLRAEVRKLHNQVESLRSASSKHIFTHLSSRLEMEARISAEMEAGTPFSLLILKIRNLPLIERQFGRQARVDAMAAFVKCLSKNLPKNAAIGRWSDDQFIGMLTLDRSEAVALTKRLTQLISEPATDLEGSQAHTLPLQFNAAVLANSKGDTYESLVRKIDSYL
jgi:GGDEF domain-containing protein